MGTHDKAQRTTVQIGPLSVDGCQMPEINVRQFLDARGIKPLRGEGYTPDSVAIESTDQSRCQSRGHALSLHIISAYWAWEASKSNQPLCYTLMAETLERRFDAALGVKHRESDRDALLTQRLQQTESALAALGEAYAEPDLLRMEVEHLRQQLRDAGLEP